MVWAATISLAVLLYQQGIDAASRPQPTFLAITPVSFSIEAGVRNLMPKGLD